MRKKTPRKITETYLHNAGLYYLERFASSSANFRQVMLRKIKRSCMHHTDQSYDECAALVDKTVKKFIRVGLLDDALYVRTKINALRRRGKSARAISAYLKSKGLGFNVIEHGLAQYNEENGHDAGTSEFDAALTFARKKRLGPYRQKDVDDPQKEIQKDLGKLARAGFSYDTSRRVLDKNSKK